jgi:hypothetical protein
MPDRVENSNKGSQRDVDTVLFQELSQLEQELVNETTSSELQGLFRKSRSNNS